MLVRKFLAKDRTVIIPQAPYSLDLDPADFCLFRKLKTPMILKRLCYDCGDKRKMEGAAVGDTKNQVSEVFRGLKKTLA